MRLGLSLREKYVEYILDGINTSDKIFKLWKQLDVIADLRSKISNSENNKMNAISDVDAHFIKLALIHTIFDFKDDLRDENINEERRAVIKATIEMYEGIKRRLEDKEDE